MAEQAGPRTGQVTGRQHHRFRRPRGAGPVGPLLVVLAGVLGVSQLLLSWSTVVFGVNLPADGNMTGWEVFRTAKAAAAFSGTSALGAASVLFVAIAGGVLVLAGISMVLSPVGARLGLIAVPVSALIVVAAALWTVQARTLTGRGLGDLFAHAGLGWYCFLLAGPIGLIGSWEFSRSDRTVRP